MHARLLPAQEFRRERWRNGAGWTREVLSMPEDAAAFDWRASIAEIDQDCSFSRFEGCERHMVLLAGDGGRLEFADGRSIELAPPHGRASFDGDQAPACTVSGRLQVFNLIARRGRVRAELLHRPLVGPMVFLPEAATSWLVLLVAGHAQLPDHPRRLALAQGDALLLAPEAGGPARTVMSGGGEVLLARLTRLPTADEAR